MKYKIIAVFLLLSIIFLFGCNKTNYVITATNHWKEPSYYKYLSNDVADALRKVEQGTDSVNSYSAKSIISFTEKSVRFIDNTGKEQFVSADEIKIVQTK